MEKQSSVRKKRVIVAVSGGFDPLHVGHTRLFQKAKALGDELVVILNNDNWLRKKKGQAFMHEQERKELIEALAAVDKVVLTGHSKNPVDMSVCVELKKIRPHIFAQGGDRTKQDGQNLMSSQNPEVNLCAKMDIKIIYNVGHGGKVQSSSWLLAKYIESNRSEGKLREA